MVKLTTFHKFKTVFFYIFIRNDRKIGAKSGSDLMEKCGVPDHNYYSTRKFAETTV